MRAFLCLLQEAAKDREHVHLEGKKHMLELLQGIDGAFRPGVLTSLMVRPAFHASLSLLHLLPDISFQCL